MTEWPRPLWEGTKPLSFSEQEWANVLAANCIAHVKGEHIEVLYRHWRWAHYLKGRYATELLKSKRRRDAGIPLGFDEADPDQVLGEPSRFQIPLEEPEWAAHYTWQAVLWSVIEACDKVGVALPATLGDDVSLVSQCLRQQRNGVMHPGEKAFWDRRLIQQWDEDGDFKWAIARVHAGLGGLIMCELHLRDARGLTGPQDTRPPDDDASAALLPEDGVE